MFAGVTSSNRATCPNTEMCRRDRTRDSEVRPVRCSTSSFRARSYHRIPAAVSDTSGGKHLESLHQLILTSRCLRLIVIQTKQMSGIYGAWCRVSGSCRSISVLETS